MSDLQIPPDKMLTVRLTLTAQHWANLQRFLDQNAPHWLARPLLDEIQRQCMEQVRPAPMRVSGGQAVADQGNGERS